MKRSAAPGSGEEPLFKALLVDDEMFVRQGLRTLIDWRACGFAVCGEADNGAEALERIVSMRPDLVVTDIRMPLMTGLELIRKAAESGFDDVSFMILSGYEDFKYAQMAVRWSVHDYLLKPVDEDELQSALLKLAERLRAARAHAGTGRALADRLLAAIEENDAEAVRQAAGLLAAAVLAERAEARGPADGAPVERLIAAVTGTIASMGGSPDGLRTRDALARWNVRTAEPGALPPALTAFALESAAMMAELRRALLHGSIGKIKAYIENHFSEPLSLKSIAGQFYMNPVYVGQLFRRTYGVYFNEFLLGMRIGEARRLLRQTELRVYEIAERVGFGSADYFVTQFEKREGMTPSAYRSRLLRGPERERGGHETHEKT